MWSVIAHDFIQGGDLLSLPVGITVYGRNVEPKHWRYFTLNSNR